MTETKEMDLISVIIPIYKVEEYLPACLDSVLVQTYQNLEIILVDDGSPDNCPALCDEYAKRDSRVMVYHKTNGGLSDARNYGTARASGSYIAYIDSDDCVAPNYIEYLYRPVFERRVDVSCCGLVEFEEDPCCFAEAESEPLEIISGKQACDWLLSRRILALAVAWAKLVRADLARQYPFPLGRIHEDEATTCKYLYASSRVAIGWRGLYGYRQRRQSIMRIQRDRISDDAVWCMSHRAEWFSTQGEKDLAQKSWSIVLHYILADSFHHQRRSSGLLWDLTRYCSKIGALQGKLKVKMVLYHLFPRISSICMKIRGW